MKTTSLLILLSLFWLPAVWAGQLNLSIELPKLDVSPYHRPYLSVWVEDSQRKPITTIALWKRLEKGDKWLKDLRQFWRKQNLRNPVAVDAVTSATRRPATYQFQWKGEDEQGKALANGKYVLHIEAAREEGGRDYLRIPFNWGQKQQIEQHGKAELGAIHVDVSE